MSERIIIIGTSALARVLAAEFTHRHPGRYSFLGVIGESREAEAEAEDFGGPWLGTLEDLKRILSDRAPDSVVVAPDENYGHLPADLLVEIQADRHLVVEAGTEA